MSNPCRSNFASGTRLVDEDGTNALAIRLPYVKSRSMPCVKGPEKQSVVSHTDGGVVATSTTSWVGGLLLEGFAGGSWPWRGCAAWLSGRWKAHICTWFLRLGCWVLLSLSCKCTCCFRLWEYLRRVTCLVFEKFFFVFFGG